MDRDRPVISRAVKCEGKIVFVFASFTYSWLSSRVCLGLLGRYGQRGFCIISDFSFDCVFATLAVGLLDVSLSSVKPLGPALPRLLFIHWPQTFSSRSRLQRVSALRSRSQNLAEVRLGAAGAAGVRSSTGNWAETIISMTGKTGKPECQKYIWLRNNNFFVIFTFLCR